MRDRDLRSPRFFDTENYPVITFTAGQSRHVSSNHWTVAGDLTIRDVTRPMWLDIAVGGLAQDSRGNTKLAFAATTQLARIDFDLTTELLEESGPDTGTDIDVHIDVEAVLKS